jgi:pyruvate,water dikinase
MDGCLYHERLRISHSWPQKKVGSMTAKNQKIDSLHWFADLDRHDVESVGGKNASLGEMIRALKKQKVRVPDGFATTAAAYRHFLAANGLNDKITGLLEELQKKHLKLEEAGQKIRQLFKKAEFPSEIREDIEKAYEQLSGRYKVEQVDVAVRSSATAEDLPDASFAGQQETFLNVTGVDELMEACRNCYASLFTNRAISYRQEKGFEHMKVALSVGVQKMVRSDKAGSGVMFSIDTETGFPRVVMINAAWGLGENVVQGTANPDA